jgi:hypothetical protein
LSYHRAGESGSKSGSPSMTVCTNDVALGDLVEHDLPVAVAEAVGDVEALASEMVELEDQRIGLAAVDAGTLQEELDEIGGALGDDGLLAKQGLGDVALPVRGIVLVFVGGSAGAAVVVPLAAGLRRQAKSEIGRDRWQRPQTRVVAGGSGAAWTLGIYERMFP